MVVGSNTGGELVGRAAGCLLSVVQEDQRCLWSRTNIIDWLAEVQNGRKSKKDGGMEDTQSL